MDDNNYMVGFGVGLFYGLLAWRAFQSRRSWRKLLDYAFVAFIAFVGFLVIYVMTGGLAKPTGGRAHMQVHCIANLKLIQGAIIHWAEDHGKKDTDIPQASDLFGETKYIKTQPICPFDGTYKWGSAQDEATCSNKGHQLGARLEREPWISEETRTLASGVGSGLGAVAAVALLLAAWRRWR